MHTQFAYHTQAWLGQQIHFKSDSKRKWYVGKIQTCFGPTFDQDRFNWYVITAVSPKPREGSKAKMTIDIVVRFNPKQVDISKLETITKTVMRFKDENGEAETIVIEHAPKPDILSFAF